MKRGNSVTVDKSGRGRRLRGREVEVVGGGEVEVVGGREVEVVSSFMSRHEYDDDRDLDFNTPETDASHPQHLLSDMECVVCLEIPSGNVSACLECVNIICQGRAGLSRRRAIGRKCFDSIALQIAKHFENEKFHAS